MRLLYVCDAVSGGIAEYAIRQVTALAEVGTEVIFLCRGDFPVERLPGHRVDATLPKLRRGGPVWQKVLNQIQDGRALAKSTTNTALALSVDAILLACYSEYFSPFWAPIYRLLAGRGIPIGTIAHDPVRDYRVGPKWWHQWSVRQAYSFMEHVFVHDDTTVDFGGPKPSEIQVHEIPHGPFDVPKPKRGRSATRKHYGLEDSDTTFLSFGQVRDGKNLERFLRAMNGLPTTVKLLVAGTSGGGSQRPPEYYVRLAGELGLADRCVWDFRYIPDENISDLFGAADVVLMTYSARFRSASGVLNTAVSCRRPVLASSGDGPLRTEVERYQLGIWIPPDNNEAILAGAHALLDYPQDPDWEGYERDHSWSENAKRVIAALSA